MPLRFRRRRCQSARRRGFFFGAIVSFIGSFYCAGDLNQIEKVQPQGENR